MPPIAPDSALANGAALTFGLGAVAFWDVIDRTVTLDTEALGLIGAGAGVLAAFLVRLLYRALGIKPPPVEPAPVVPVEPERKETIP